MTAHRPQIQFVDADRRPGIESMLDRLYPWMIKPERNLYCALLEGLDAEETVRRWITHEESELALQCTTLMVADDRVCGGFTGFAGRQLRRRRERDLIDLVRHTRNRRSSRLRNRLKDLMPLFAPVAPHDFYLSKCGLAPGYRDTDLGEVLVDETIDRAERDGFDRIRIDIDAGNESLRLDLAERGFEVFDRGEAREAGITYLNMVRDP